MDGIEALIFDVFGTTVDWRTTVEQELRDLGKKYSIASTNADWAEFAQEWRTGYMNGTKRIAFGGQGTFNVDIMHREILDGMLASPRWSHLGQLWDEVERRNLNNVWHRLKGWPDTTEGLYALKKQFIITSLSNGNVRLLVDMAKHANLPWDTIFSTELFNTFKPNPAAYLGTARHLSLPPEKCAMVASHFFDLEAAAKQGMKTIYISRLKEDGVFTDKVRSKEDGGEVDLVVSSFVELAEVLARGRK
ncbi:haloacid dehalogenase [Tricholoma matsutake]|nr:haloacid dehalogenase [Tricholoma matsutake 945]